MLISFQQINTVTSGLAVSAPLNTLNCLRSKKFGGQIVFWILNLFLSGANSLWVICSKISTHKSFTYSINLPLPQDTTYPEQTLSWTQETCVFVCDGKAAAPCVWADGSHGEADDHCADVQKLRIKQVGGKLDRTHEELQHKPNMTFLQMFLTLTSLYGVHITKLWFS